jgi:hypothetical protein
MLRRSYVIIAGLFVLSAICSCNSAKKSKSKRLPGVWQAAPVVVDGKNNEWPSPYPEYDDKAMIGYAVSNDKNNLYITVETGDPATQLKILREGLTVWIDRTGQKEEATAINYPIPHEAAKGSDEVRRPSSSRMQGSSSGTANSEDRMRIELEDRVRRALPDANEYSLQGFKSCNLQYPIMESDSCGIAVHMSLDSDNEVIWEAAIPFKTFYFKNEITRADKGRALTVIIETVGEKRPAGQNSGGHGNNGGSGGGFRPSVGMGGMGMGMRMGGGGMRGSRGNSNQNNTNNVMEPLYKSTKTYKKFGLAFQ